MHSVMPDAKKDNDESVGVSKKKITTRRKPKRGSPEVERDVPEISQFFDVDVLDRPFDMNGFYEVLCL